MTDLTALTNRLEYGWSLIDAARTPAEAQRLTDHWLVVLAEYQAAADVELWEIAAQHEWRPSMTAQLLSQIPLEV